jgi:hypothetical protein
MKIKGKILRVALIALFAFGGMSASAGAPDTFYGGATGIGNWGIVWGEFRPVRFSRVYVKVVGRHTGVSYATSGGRAYAEVPRKVSGNTSGWDTW